MKPSEASACTCRSIWSATWAGVPTNVTAGDLDDSSRMLRFLGLGTLTPRGGHGHRVAVPDPALGDVGASTGSTSGSGPSGS